MRSHSEYLVKYLNKAGLPAETDALAAYGRLYARETMQSRVAELINHSHSFEHSKLVALYVDSQLPVTPDRPAHKQLKEDARDVLFTSLLVLHASDFWGNDVCFNDFADFCTSIPGLQVFTLDSKDHVIPPDLEDVIKIVEQDRIDSERIDDEIRRAHPETHDN